MNTKQVRFTHVRDKESVIGAQGPWMPCIGGEQVRVEAPRRSRAAPGGTSRKGRDDVVPALRSPVRSSAHAASEPLQTASMIPGGTKA
jgi:hypothetical protein